MGMTIAVDTEVLALLRSRLHEGEDWFAYENMALDSSRLTHRQYLKCGPSCTYQTPPKGLPDTRESINWAYRLIGRVDLTNGEVKRI